MMILQPDSDPGAVADREPSTGSAVEMHELTRPDCLRLLETTSVGRVGVSVKDWDHPVIRPVNYVFDRSSQSVVIRSAQGSKLHALLRSTNAVFEIDGTDPVGRTGWSVIIAGVTVEITDPAELRRIEGLGLEPWAPGHKGHWIAIRATTVSGRRISVKSAE